MDETRIERDSLGEVAVPKDALWGAQTQRAVENFPISGRPMPSAFIAALGTIKACAAVVNGALGLLPAEAARAIEAAAEAIAEGRHDDQFPVDVFQTGSGTSSNMNANEVIASLAARAGVTVHANDDVNRCQSSNDVVPSAIQVAAVLAVRRRLEPALADLIALCRERSLELADVVKTGRTHLMDAMPVTFGQELAAWADQLERGLERLTDALRRLRAVPLGGTAVGTGINAHPEFAARIAAELSRRTGEPFVAAANPFEGIGAQDGAAELSGQLKVLAVSLMKIANDLRWMNSGPNAGLGEITLPALQPGSSIMPGKVNPVVPEAVAMVCAQVVGHDAAITIGAQAGNFELNVMLPMIGANLLTSIELLANAGTLLGARAIAGFEVRRERSAETVARNPILVTALNARLGYETGARIAKRAQAEQRTVAEVAREHTDLSADELAALLDPLRLTRGGIPGSEG